jgi:hypothetical protein
MNAKEAQPAAKCVSELEDDVLKGAGAGGFQMMEYYWLVDPDHGCLNHFAGRSCSKRDLEQKGICL